MKKGFVYLLSILVLFSCMDDHNECSEEEDSFCPDLIIPLDNQDSMIFQEATIFSAIADQENIHLQIGVSGCGSDRNFQLNVSQFMIKTYPPQRTAWITYTPEPCEAYFKVDLCFEREEIEEATWLNLITANDTTRLLLPASR